MKKIIIFFAVYFFTLVSCNSQKGISSDSIVPYSQKKISEDIIPSLNGWLLYRKNNQYADWLGIKYFNKKLREPINIIIIDAYAKSRKEAIDTEGARL